MGILFNLLVAAQAKTSLNSMCYMLDKPGSKMQGDHSEELFEIASVSKVVTSYWAIRELGPQFKFRTRIHITPVGHHLFDVHIQGSRDPFWGRQLTHFLFAELNKIGVREIRKLTFDENLIFRWSVISDSVDPMEPSAQEIEGALERHLKSLATEYPRTRREAAALGMKLPNVLSLKTQSVAYLPTLDVKLASETVSYALRSAPLYRYLKEMNAVSNNHVADHLFDYLGGPGKFKNFIQRDMNLDSTDIQLVNGSGNSVVGTKVSGGGVKEYNKASCDTIVRILMKMQAELRNKSGLELKDVMAVSGADQGTLKPRFDSIRNGMVAKTGTVDPAVTLAGMISTAEGDAYFGIFMGTSSPADWNNARDRVRQKVLDLMTHFGGRKSIRYTARDFMPFDQNSGMTSLIKNLETTP
jgi:D-alanyl-D-alanine carboxypeptidase